MTGGQASLIGLMRRHAKDLTILLGPYWRGTSNARVLIGGLCAVAAALGTLNAVGSYGARIFLDAAQGHYIANIWLGLVVSFCAAIGTALAHFAQTQLRMAAAFEWRVALTHSFGEVYLAGRTPFVIERAALGTHVDQRLAEDCRHVPDDALILLVSLVSNLAGLLGFGVVLWEAAPPLAVSFLGEVEIRGYMLFFGLIYVVAASWITHRLARHLTQLYREGEGREAKLRAQLLRVRDNAEHVAMTHAGAMELKRLKRNLKDIGDNWRGQRLNLARTDFLKTFFIAASSVITMAVFVPMFLSGKMSLGEITQLGVAMGAFIGLASWFLTAYDQVTRLRASMDRLLTLQRSLAAAEEIKRRGIRLIDSSDKALEVHRLRIASPTDGHPLVPVDEGSLNFRFEHGQNVLFWARSGTGKSSILRVVAGIWPWGEGEVEFRADDAIFLPQKPYISAGRFGEAVVYPLDADAVSSAALKEALGFCRLERFVNRLEEEGSWDAILSLGERQRVALVRAFLCKPRWLFLDEATSALDAPVERFIYRSLREHLPNTTVVSCSHNEELVHFHDRIFELCGRCGRKVTDCADALSCAENPSVRLDENAAGVGARQKAPRR